MKSSENVMVFWLLQGEEKLVDLLKFAYYLKQNLVTIPSNDWEWRVVKATNLRKYEYKKWFIR